MARIGRLETSAMQRVRAALARAPVVEEATYPEFVHVSEWDTRAAIEVRASTRALYEALCR